MLRVPILSDGERRLVRFAAWAHVHARPPPAFHVCAMLVALAAATSGAGGTNLLLFLAWAYAVRAFAVNWTSRQLDVALREYVLQPSVDTGHAFSVLIAAGAIVIDATFVICWADLIFFEAGTSVSAAESIAVGTIYASAMAAMTIGLLVCLVFRDAMRALVVYRSLETAFIGACLGGPLAATWPKVTLAPGEAERWSPWRPYRFFEVRRGGPGGTGLGLADNDDPDSASATLVS
jgi:hypothetical protein